MIRLSTPARYSVAVAAAITAIVLRFSFDPLWGVKLPYITHFPAIMVAAWLGGLGPGILTTRITAAATQYFWIEPTNSWRVTETSELIGLLVFLAVGVVVSALNDAWPSGATALSESEDRLRVTLTSIGDAIITTDERATAKPLDEVLVILNEEDRQPAQNSVDELLSSGVVSGFANHTVLACRAHSRPLGSGTAGTGSDKSPLERDQVWRWQADRTLAAGRERRRPVVGCGSRDRYQTGKAATTLRAVRESRVGPAIWWIRAGPLDHEAHRRSDARDNRRREPAR